MEILINIIIIKNHRFLNFGGLGGASSGQSSGGAGGSGNFLFDIIRVSILK